MFRKTLKFGFGGVERRIREEDTKSRSPFQHGYVCVRNRLPLKAFQLSCRNDRLAFSIGIDDLDPRFEAVVLDILLCELSRFGIDLCCQKKPRGALPAC